MKKRYDVLVTDSRTKHSLAAIRNLGMHGLNIITCSDGFSPSRYSRYSKDAFFHNDSDFIEKLIDAAKKNKIGLIMPIGYKSNIECSKNKRTLEKYSRVMVPKYNSLKIAEDKLKTYEHLKSIDIPHPRTYIVKEISDISMIDKESKYVIKSKKELLGKKVEYCNDASELKQVLKRRLEYGDQVVQEYIEGFGCGFFALCDNGKVLSSFQHKRIRQYPETGGVSSAAESFYDKKIETYGRKIIESLGWTGMIMVEFIYDISAEDYRVIELNGKFWGSLDLPISCGIEFPYQLYRYSQGKFIEKSSYIQGMRFQWLLPEDLLRIKTAKKKKKEAIVCLKDFLDPAVKKDISYIFIDPIPTLIRIISTIYRLVF